MTNTVTTSPINKNRAILLNNYHLQNREYSKAVSVSYFCLEVGKIDRKEGVCPYSSIHPAASATGQKQVYLFLCSTELFGRLITWKYH